MRLSLSNISFNPPVPDVFSPISINPTPLIYGPQLEETRLRISFVSSDRVEEKVVGSRRRRGGSLVFDIIII
jgi:hypothetical protein